MVDSYYSELFPRCPDAEKSVFCNRCVFCCFLLQAGVPPDVAKMEKDLKEAQSEAQKAKEENVKLSAQVKTSTEEQALKEKLIKELQE